jgi:hypothetical protein
MPSNDNNKQKSLKRRFLLILGAATFVWGILIIFWDKLYISFGLSLTQRILFGGLLIGYYILRFTILSKNQPDE